MKKIDTVSLRSQLSSGVDFYVCCASFEQRSITIASHFSSFSDTATLIFFANTSQQTEVNRAELRRLSGARASEVELFQSAPVRTADAIAAAMTMLIGGKDGHLVIDTTCFTHEHLLILIRYLVMVLKRGESKVRVSLAYSGAENYSHNTSKGEMWLSRGVREVRPVIGYSGRFSISKPVQLIILVGFEHERAKAAIEFVEPGYLVLGRGKQGDSVSPELAVTNAEFHERLTKFVEKMAAMFSTYQMFEFSAVDSSVTCEEILAIANPEERNVILCPMNTKVSTVGAACAAIADPRIQLMYVEPLEYNIEGYSKPGTHYRYGELPR